MYYKIPGELMQMGLRQLKNDATTITMSNYARVCGVIEILVEHNYESLTDDFLELLLEHDFQIKEQRFTRQQNDKGDSHKVI